MSLTSIFSLVTRTREQLPLTIGRKGGNLLVVNENLILMDES